MAEDTTAGMTIVRSGNAELDRLLIEAGYRDRRRAFARLVNQCAERYGVVFDYDHTSVKRWLVGSIPNAPAPDAIAETLTDLLGYTVTPADLGWRAAAADDRGLRVEVVPARTLGAIAGLTGQKMNRRDILQSAAAVGAVAFSDAALHSLAESYHPITAAAGTGARLGAVDAALIRETTGCFRRLDAVYGAGRLLDDVSNFLHAHTKKVLCASYFEAAGRDLFMALAELTKLAGWMARDVNQSGLAQRYLIQALALAEHASDRSLAVGVLDAMSHQAMHSQEPQRAVALARAALARGNDGLTPAQDAAVHGTEASALALAGDRRACAEALVAADAAWEQHGDGEPAWMAHYAETDIAFKAALSHRLLGQGGPAECHIKEALALCPPERVRHRALCHLELSTSRVVGRASAAVDVEGAVEAGNSALALAEGLRSTRVEDALRGLRSRLVRWQDQVAVREFDQRASAVLHSA